MAFEKIHPKDLQENVFSLVQDKWLLVTAGTAEHCNPMTASWGSFGVFWREYVSTVYLRPQRYTCKVLDETTYYSICVFDEKYRDVLNYCGKVSGADEDKGKGCGLTIRTADCGAPYFEEADLVFICKKLYHQPMVPENILAPEVEVHYANKDYHRMFFGSIQEVLKKV